MTQWTAAGKAFAHVLSVELVPDVAHSKLTERIKKGEIPGRDGSGNVVPSNFWKIQGYFASVTIDFETGTAERNDYSLSQAAGEPIKPYATRRLAGLSFSTSHLFNCFPSASQPGGRPPAADWGEIEKALEREIKTVGFPDRSGAPGWRFQADVIKFIEPLLGEDEPGKTALKENVKAMLDRIKSRMAGN
jgi:hypothetical protein